jgi:hypothetical protein
MTPRRKIDADYPDFLEGIGASEGLVEFARAHAEPAMTPTARPRKFRTAPMKDGIRYDDRGEPVSDPRTEAGKLRAAAESLRSLATTAMSEEPAMSHARLVDAEWSWSAWDAVLGLADELAIEAESAQAREDELRAAVEALRNPSPEHTAHHDGFENARAAVLRLLSGEPEAGS